MIGLIAHINSPLVSNAVAYAAHKHGETVDDEGKNYFAAHVWPVADMIASLVDLDKDYVVAAALLHDVIEDTDATEEEVRTNFGDLVTDLVLEVTQEGDKQRGFYFPRLHSKYGIMIKFADRLSNLSRMGGWDEKRQAHYLKRSKFWKSE